MKKLILIALSMALVNCFFVADTFAAATLVPDTDKTEKQVGSNTRYIYIVNDTVETGTPEVFKIPVLKTAGKIDEASFVSTSPDVRIHLNGLDGQSFTEQPVLDWEIDTLGWSQEIKARDYVNMDTTQIKFLYFTIINNSATATGEWTLTLDFIRN
jgi:hypothetical protein